MSPDEYEAAIGALADRRGGYVVVLESRGNIDFGQDHRRSLPGVRRRQVRVASLKAASQACRLYIAHHELGGGNWTGGQVFTHDRQRTVAQISYNGRAWKPGPYPQPEIALEVTCG